MRNWKVWIPLLALFALAMQDPLSCEPTILVRNKTTIGVRVAIFPPGGGKAMVSPSPGFESEVVIDTFGRYTAAVVPDQEWLAYAKAKRQVLNDLLANSQTLSGDQLLQLIRELKDLAARMQAYEQAARSGTACSGAVQSAGEVPFLPIGPAEGGVVTVATSPDGQLQLTCE